MPRNLILTTTLVLSIGCSSSDKKPEKTGGDKAAAAPCSCGTATAAKEGATCSCADVNGKKAGWCDHCGSGYAEGKRTECEKCARANKMCPDCEGGKPCADCSKKG